jgi:hypothetical protein
MLRACPKYPLIEKIDGLAFLLLFDFELLIWRCFATAQHDAELSKNIGLINRTSF